MCVLFVFIVILFVFIVFYRTSICTLLKCTVIFFFFRYFCSFPCNTFCRTLLVFALHTNQYENKELKGLPTHTMAIAHTYAKT